MAPVTKKPGAGYISSNAPKKSTSNIINKSSNISSTSKSSSSSLGKSSKPSYSAPVPKSTPSSSSTSKNYLAPSYTSNKSNKSSSNFGIIWIPTKRHNKKKDLVYNPHQNDRHRERSPSMYRYLNQNDVEKSVGETPTLPKVGLGAAVAVDPLIGDKSKEPVLELDKDTKDDYKDYDYKDNHSESTTSTEKNDKCVKCFYCCLDTLDCSIM